MRDVKYHGAGDRVIMSVWHGNQIAAAVNVPYDNVFRVFQLLFSRFVRYRYRHRRFFVFPGDRFAIQLQTQLNYRFSFQTQLGILIEFTFVRFGYCQRNIPAIPRIYCFQHITGDRYGPDMRVYNCYRSPDTQRKWEE